MDLIIIITIVGGVVGIIAGVVQVIQYFQGRKEKKVSSQSQKEEAKNVPELIPNNLPPRSEFVGREKEKALIHEALRSRSYLVSVDGIGGIGKSTLALEVVYECLTARRSSIPSNKIAKFDGFIWASARDRDVNIDSLLNIIAQTLDQPGVIQMPVGDKRIAVR
jgi:hypothetical protein